MNSLQGPLREKNHLSPKCQRRISKEEGRQKARRLQPHQQRFLCARLCLVIFCLVFFFVPACQSNGVETDRLILESSLEAELQHGSNIQRKKKPIWGRTRIRRAEKMKPKVCEVEDGTQRSLSCTQDSSGLSDQRLI